MRRPWIGCVLLGVGCSVGVADLPGDPTSPPDSGPSDDAGASADAGDAGDAGTAEDAGSGHDAGPADAGPDADGGPPDSGPPSHSSCTQTPDLKGATSRTALGNPYFAYVPPSYDPMRPAPLVVAALEDVQKCYSVDPKRVVLNGFSAGGSMAYFIGLSRAQLFSGLAIQSSSLSAGEYAAGGPLLPAPWKVPVSHFHGDQDLNFQAADAKAGIDRLEAAGHPVFWHLFTGGHQARAQDALAEYDELKGFASP